MAQLPAPFDATTVAPNEGKPPPLPTDWYNVIITESETALTKKGKPVGTHPESIGSEEWLVSLVMKVMDGPYAGRLCYDRLNLGNLNPVALEIAQGSLSAICHAINVFQVADTQVLHGIPLMVKYVEKGPKDGYDAGNDAKGYAKVGEKQSSNANNIKLEPIHGDTPAAPVAPGPAAAGAPTYTPPWKTEGAVEAPVAPVAPVAVAPVAPVAVAPVAPVAVAPVAPVAVAPVAVAPVAVAPVAPVAVAPVAPVAPVNTTPPPVTVAPTPAAVAPVAPVAPIDPNIPPWKTTG